MMIEPKWLGILLTVLLLQGWLCTDACWEHERIALLQLKPFFNRYHRLNNWVEVKGSDCCQWERVECNTTTKRVIGLSLNFTRGQESYKEYRREKEHWYLNASLFVPFKELKSLYLPGNHIAGCIENEGLTELSSTLGDLEILDLSGNYLNDSILSALSELSSLKYLNLASNHFTGSIANGFAKLSSTLADLEILDLSQNYLNDSILLSLSELSSLKYLNLASNKFKGSIANGLGFKWLSRLGNLETLDLSWNSFKNSILLHMGSFSSLKTLSLRGNELNGTVHIEELNDLVNLRKLDLSEIKIESLRSSQDSGRQLKLTHLEELDLSDNCFNDSVFASLSGVSNLKWLRICYNLLEGSIEMKGCCELKNLEALDVSRNKLKGGLPSCIGNLTSLRALDISYNQLTGNLTPLANLTSLTFLSLSRNHFQVPLSFISQANLPHLKILFCDENKLVMEPTFQTSVPKFQLYLISLSKRAIDQELIKELPKFLYYQHDLRYVDLSYSKFNGTVPFWLLENNTNLEALFLMGNSFTGPLLLPSLPNPRLFSIDISKNKIQAQIPVDICSTFPHLKWLFLSTNAFEGNIPSCLGGMSNLLALDLSNNQLSGGVLEDLSINSSLGENNFVGERFDIDILNLDFFNSLFHIDLSNNNLSGKLPRWIWTLSNLEILVLSNNHFEDSIGMELCNLDGLQVLDLCHNNLSGSIPSCFNPPNIKHVHLSGNRLSGPLTRALYGSSSLVTLDLRGNNLTGNIPEWIDTPSALSVLVLKANHLDGKIPIQLCKLYSLSIIDLSQNMLSGPIPSCLGNLTLVSSFDKSPTNKKYELDWQELPKHNFPISRLYSVGYMKEKVQLTTKNRSYDYEGQILLEVSTIDLSCNKLTGQIPLELGKLSEIHSLNFSHNNLMGVIPSSFSNFKQIESLDLSYNNLTGRISVQLAELNFLAVFSVAHNNLSGSTLERKGQFGTFDESSYEGNPLLCGPPLHNNCSKTDLPPIVSTASDEEGEGSLLDTYVFCVSFLVSYVVVLLGIFAVLYINPYWRRAWFSFIEDCISACRFSIVGNILELYIFKTRA